MTRWSVDHGWWLADHKAFTLGSSSPHGPAAREGMAWPEWRHCHQLRVTKNNYKKEGGHPGHHPFKIPESIIYTFLVASDMRVSLNIYVPLNVTKFDRHFFVWENVIFVMWLHSLYYCWDVSITDSVITTFFEVFRLFKFVNKIRCTENYLELHETNDIYENPINQRLIWNLILVYVIARTFAWHALEPCKVKVLGFSLQNIFGLYITLWKLSF